MRANQIDMKFFKVTLLIIAFYLINSVALAQKLYVWCPNDLDIVPRMEVLKSDTLKVAFFDARILSKKSKLECSSDALQNSILIEIKKAYPYAIIINDNNIYHKKQSKDNVLKIGISAYHAGFGVEVNSGIGVVSGSISPIIFPKGMWNASTILYLQSSKEGIAKEKVIEKVSSRNNTWGYKSARSALSETYLGALQDMLFFIDSNFMQ